MSRKFSPQAWMIFGFLLLFALASFKAVAQKDAQPLEDVVYLTNGSIIRGTMIELKINQFVKIEDRAGNIWVFAYDEVDKITKEARPVSAYSSNRQRLLNISEHEGFYMGTALGMNLGDANDGVSYTSEVLGFLHVSMGYKLKNGLSFGGVTGLEGWGTSAIPLFADVRYQIFKGPVSPFVYGQGGVIMPLDNFNSNGPSPGTGFGLGVRRMVGNRTAIDFNIGYRFQRLDVTYQDWWATRETRYDFNRVTVGLGVIF
ncbi:MAG: hypothetical protein ACFB10_26615 [Salibacteraceae bacterium]